MRSSREDVGSQQRRAERRSQQKGRASHAKGDTVRQKKPAECDRCGSHHKQQDKCPAKGKQCLKCKKHNHFAVKCRTVKKVLEVEEDSDCDTFSVGSVVTKSSKQVCADLQVGPNKSLIQFKLDTGACCNIISETEFKRLKVTAPLQKPKARLLAYTGAEIKVLGTIRLHCNYKAKKQNVEFYVARNNKNSILGLQSCLDFGLIKVAFSVNPEAPMTKETILTEYKDVFTGIGRLPGTSSIQIDSNHTPVVHPPRRVPVAMQDKVMKELQNMEKAGIITKVNKPTSYVNSMVVVNKPHSDKVRIVIDPKDLNKAIKRPHYPTKTLDDILPQLKSAKYFTKLDCKSGYHSVVLDQKSSYLTTFNTPQGRYRYLRCPMGLKCSQDLFQQKIDECLEGISGCAIIVDDLLVYGQTIHEHDSNLRTLLDRCREKGIRLNEDKLIVGASEVKYFGHIVSADGLKPDPEKCRAIREMEPPSDKSELKTLIGMVTYLSRYAPHLSQTMQPLSELLKNDIQFSWEEPQIRAFQEIKDILTASPGPILSYFDPDKTLTLQCDSSQHGCAATLMQEGKPIAYASKTLTSTERNWAMIEKELLAIVFGMTKFRQYVYGRHVIVETDHLPLISVFKKSLHSAPARLQRLLLALHGYDLELHYKSGTQIPVADTLSRKFLPDTYPEISENSNLHVHFVTRNLPYTSQKLVEIRTETDKDEELLLLKQVILQGWPDKRNQCDPRLIDYWTYRDELSVVDNIIYKGHRLVIPKSLRNAMLTLIHKGHAGQERSMRRARMTMFWPNISKHIISHVAKCTVCATHQRSNQKEPLKPHDVPQYPWQVVGTDVFTFDNQDYLIVCDYLSNYFEMQKLSNTNSQTIIKVMKTWFATHGIPEKIVSDGASYYTSQQFQEFAIEWDIQHVTSSAQYPQSNGLSESCVKKAKKLLKKCKQDGSDPMISLLELRATPMAIGYSPCEMLMGRKIRTFLPIAPSQLTPSTVLHSKVRSKLISQKADQKRKYDKHAKQLKPMNVGDNVRIQQGAVWNPAVITEQNSERSYTVKTPDGGQYVRNRRHLQKIPVSSPAKAKPPGESLGTPLESASPCKPKLLQTETPQVPSQQRASVISNPTPSSPIQPPVSACTDKPPENTQTPYITRSGRQIKPRKIESM